MIRPFFLSAFLLTLILTTFSFETKYVPALMWSGNKGYFEGKYVHESKCAVKNIKDQLLYGKFNQNTPKYIVGFFQEEVNRILFYNSLNLKTLDLLQVLLKKRLMEDLFLI